MSLDMEAQSKNKFMAAFSEHILQPRGLDYKLQFVGPTGANAVEAAIKLARKVTGRTNIVAFTNEFHIIAQQSRPYLQVSIRPTGCDLQAECPA